MLYTGYIKKRVRERKYEMFGAEIFQIHSLYRLHFLQVEKCVNFLLVYAHKFNLEI